MIKCLSCSRQQSCGVRPKYPWQGQDCPTSTFHHMERVGCRVSSAYTRQRLTCLMRVHQVEAERIEGLARFQEAALRHALRFPALQRLVYSTCSVRGPNRLPLMYRPTCADVSVIEVVGSRARDSSPTSMGGPADETACKRRARAVSDTKSGPSLRAAGADSPVRVTLCARCCV